VTRIADDIRRIAVVSSAAANKDRIGATTEERRTGLGMEICGVEARRNEPFRDPGHRLLVAGDPPASVIGAERGAAEDAAFVYDRRRCSCESVCPHTKKIHLMLHLMT
jgi:hypothetical protein